MIMRVVDDQFVTNDGLSHHINLVLGASLEAGAIVDRPWNWPGDYYRYWHMKPLCRWQKEDSVYSSVPMTWLDYAYYHDIRLFRKLECRSTSGTSKISRADICDAVRESTDSLRQYLQSKPPMDPDSLEHFLECVMFELFCHTRHLYYEVIINLINYGVDVRVPSISMFEVDPSTLIHGLIRTVRDRGSILRFRAIIDHLLRA